MGRWWGVACPGEDLLVSATGQTAMPQGQWRGTACTADEEEVGFVVTSIPIRPPRTPNTSNQKTGKQFSLPVLFPFLL